MFDFQFEAAMRDSLAADLKLVYSVKESIGLSLYLYLPRYFCISLQFFAGIQFKEEEGGEAPVSSCLSVFVFAFVDYFFIFLVFFCWYSI